MADPPMSTDEDDITVICPFLALADELIDYILTCELIDHRDICRFGGVCRRFNAVASANELWRKKACQRFVVYQFLFDPVFLPFKLFRCFSFSVIWNRSCINVCKFAVLWPTLLLLLLKVSCWCAMSIQQKIYHFLTNAKRQSVRSRPDSYNTQS